ESSDRRARRVLLLSALAIGGCLILTKSRSAWAALAGGLVLLPACMPELRRRLDWRVAAMLAGSLALLVAGAVAVRGLDRQVVSEAGKSLGYRLEYWQATWQMIREHPWLGCGPGNFQDAYMRYKLAVASEEIQDPHNLFFEVWGSAGTPALLALLAVLGCFAWQTWRRTTPEIASGDTGADDLASAAALPLGAAAGVILAYFVGPLMGFQLGGPDALIGVVLGGLVVAGIWPWVRRGRLPGLLLPLALLVLVVHLSAAGGISIPGVAYSFWLLLALGVNQSMGVQPLAVAPMHTVPQSRIAEAPSRTPWGAIVAMALAGAGAAACYVSAYQPVLRATAALYQAQTSEQHQDWRQYEQALLEASQADPLQSQSWPLLAALDFQRLVAHGRVAASPNEETRLQFDRALRMMLRLRPQSSAMYRQAGEWLLELYQRSGNPDDARRAVDYYRRAIELYPNSALAHGELALVLAATGDRHAAQPENERARQLDAAMPHADKKLPVDVQRQLEAIVEPAARSQAAGPQK
ncbi:MAG TPA: O-antigen ligase family protein, partial [Pirellulales bacterium]|nr:O-antigen ligase family protein [Pirellulales bacterium]